MRDLTPDNTELDYDRTSGPGLLLDPTPDLMTPTAGGNVDASNKVLGTSKRVDLPAMTTSDLSEKDFAISLGEERLSPNGSTPSKTLNFVPRTTPLSRSATFRNQWSSWNLPSSQPCDAPSVADVKIYRGFGDAKDYRQDDGELPSPRSAASSKGFRDIKSKRSISACLTPHEGAQENTPDDGFTVPLGEDPLVTLQEDDALALETIRDVGDQQYKLLKQRLAERESSIDGRRWAWLLTQFVGIAYILLILNKVWQYLREEIYSQVEPVKTQRRLDKDILHSLETTHNPGQKGPGFLPKGKLCQLITPASVRDELAASTHDKRITRNIRRIAQKVCSEPKIMTQSGRENIKSFRSIFALLAFTNTSAMIERFLDEDVSDLDLPLVMVIDPESKESELRRRLHPESDEPSTERLKCFADFSLIELMNFEQYQWAFLAPFFSHSDYNHVHHYALKNDHILPFIRPPLTMMSDELDSSEGGHGVVSMINIHEDHHDFGDYSMSRKGFAIKTLRSRDEKAFAREVNMLKRFTGHGSHHHIVSLLATYEQFGRYNLIFPRATKDLKKFWEASGSSWVMNYESIRWVAQQFEGLASGLLRLHRHYTFLRQKNDESQGGRKFSRVRTMQERCSPKRKVQERHNSAPEPALDGEWVYGRHGDLKPENILCYHDDKENGMGTLKISDFGHSEFKTQFSKSKPRSSVQHTPTYRSPECDLQPMVIRQSSDIWSLGCVILEFVTWALGGKALWKEFSQNRVEKDPFQHGFETDTFFKVVRSKKDPEAYEAMVKESVIKFIQQLHEHENCTEYFHNILNMVKYGMLIIESKDRTTDQRLTCEDTWKQLNALLRKCDNEDFAAKKNPWNKEGGSPTVVPVHVEISTQAEETFIEAESLLQ